MHARVLDIVGDAFRTQKEPAEGSLDLEQAMQIDAVAAGSPAGRMGLAEGDILLSLDGRPAAKVDWNRAVLEAGEEQSYRFHRPGSGQIVVVRSSGVPLGISLSRTTEAILAHYGRPEVDFDDLHALWKRSAWDALARISERWSSEPAPGWRRKLARIAPVKRDLPDEPELLYWGALRYELGEHDEGWSKIASYLEHYVHRWESSHASVAEFYRASELLRNGHTHDAAEAFLEAWDVGRLERAAEAAAKLGVRVPEEDLGWVGRRFPIDYDLDVKDDEVASRSLSRTLATLDDGQIHLACLLGPYRTNGPYDGFMWRLQGYYRRFADVLASVHVIVESETPHRWPDGEQAALRMGMPLTILWDEEGHCTEAIDASGSPTVVALDRRARILFCDFMADEVGFWEMLSRLAQ